MNRSATPGRQLSPRKKRERDVRPGPVSASEATRRDKEIIKIATTEFLAKGFEGATLESIARKSRISKTTLYSLFGSKEALFSHIATASIAAYQYGYEHVFEERRSFKDVIRATVELMVETTDIRSANAILRLAIAERDRFPSIAQMMLDHSFALVTPLAKYFKSVSRKGALSDQHARWLAYHLMSMACGGFGSVLVRPATLYPDRKEWIEVITDLFTEGFPLAGG